MKSLLSLCVDNLTRIPEKDVKQLNNLLLPRRVRNVLASLEIFNSLKECSQFIDKYNPSKKEDILISGSIQSGKTNEMLFYCWWSIFITRRKVIFVCRNIKADYKQLIERIDIFNKTFIKDSKFFIREIKPESKSRGIIILLANHIQLKKTWENLIGNYNICIDEADTCIKSRKTNEFKFQKYFKVFERNSSHQIGATATEFAVFSGKYTLTKIFQMKTPSNYYGIKEINKVFLPHKGIHNKSLDHNMTFVYDNLFKKERFFVLHSTAKFKDIQTEISYKLIRNYPKLTNIVFNGNGFVVTPNQEANYDRWVAILQKKFGKGKVTCLPIHEEYNINSIKIGKSVKLSELLQLMKKQKYISIIAGNLASRGLSFVSQDYKLHLTDQYYCPSENAHGETLLQGIRLFGCYNDISEENNLTLWINKNIWKDIKEQYKVLKRYIKKLKNKENLKEKLSLIKSITPNKSFSRPAIMRGVRSTSTKDGFVQLKIDSMYDFNDTEGDPEGDPEEELKTKN